jgi:hypothetical protein
MLQEASTQPGMPVVPSMLVNTPGVLSTRPNTLAEASTLVNKPQEVSMPPGMPVVPSMLENTHVVLLPTKGQYGLVPIAPDRAL